MQLGEGLADPVSEAWDSQTLNGEAVFIAWMHIVSIFSAERPYRKD